MKKAIPCHQQGKQGGSEDGEELEVVGGNVPVVIVLFTSGGLVD